MTATRSQLRTCPRPSWHAEVGRGGFICETATIGNLEIVRIWRDAWVGMRIRRRGGSPNRTELWCVARHPNRDRAAGEGSDET